MSAGCGGSVLREYPEVITSEEARAGAQPEARRVPSTATASRNLAVITANTKTVVENKNDPWASDRLLVITARAHTHEQPTQEGLV